jgi:hypothetical protein
MEAALEIEEPIASPFKATETLCGLPPVHQESFWRALLLCSSSVLFALLLQEFEEALRSSEYLLPNLPIAFKSKSSGITASMPYCKDAAKVIAFLADS